MAKVIAEKAVEASEVKMVGMKTIVQWKISGNDVEVVDYVESKPVDEAIQKQKQEKQVLKKK